MAHGLLFLLRELGDELLLLLRPILRRRLDLLELLNVREQVLVLRLRSCEVCFEALDSFGLLDDARADLFKLVDFVAELGIAKVSRATSSETGRSATHGLHRRLAQLVELFLLISASSERRLKVLHVLAQLGDVGTLLLQRFRVGASAGRERLKRLDLLLRMQKRQEGCAGAQRHQLTCSACFSASMVCDVEDVSEARLQAKLNVSPCASRRRPAILSELCQAVRHAAQAPASNESR